MPNPQNLTVPQKGEVRNPKGRPKSAATLLREAWGDEFGIDITKSQAERIMLAIAFKSRAELTLMKSQQDQLPMFVETLIGGLFADLKIGKVDTLEKIFNRVHGTPVQKTENTISGPDGQPGIVFIIPNANDRLQKPE